MGSFILIILFKFIRIGYRHIKLKNKANKGTLFVGIKIEVPGMPKKPLNLTESPVEQYEVFEKSN